MNEQQVAVVLDPDYGAQLTRLAVEYPVWIVASEPNDQAARALWARGGFSVTTFASIEADRRVENLLRVLPDIDLHHSTLSSVLVIGVNLSAAIVDRLKAGGLGDVVETACGFVVHRKRQSETR